MTDLTAIVKDTNTMIVDVRTPEEFMGGHVTGSINIPLHEVPNRVDEFRGKDHVVLCCASGGRSGQATMFLTQHGINCSNGGSWLNVNYIKNN